MEVPAESTLQMVERHVREGEGHIARQKALSVQLQEHGQAVMLLAAEEFLLLLEGTQALHCEHAARERLASN